ncbi:HlyD family secretion protein [Bradyrhizobium sp.]|uniref:HlyD family secretion protein n=1 Tax=Bradyrhizobium sp. TaxID=376 RepID=UPI002B838CB3|nr:HlyD family secretion protein [Bradyrhizobium sp.]HWX64620.1 HlyD family secretion protein [Bradyrhizobium sp.]
MTDTAQAAQLRTSAPHAGARVAARLKQAVLVLAVAAAVFGAAEYGSYYWTTGRYLVSTDDAYVDVHSAMISPKVSGYISDVPVNDNQPVKAGQVIARIDPRDYQTALDKARANVAAAQATIDTLTQQIAQQSLTVEQARQQVASDQAALVYSHQDFQRYTDLERTGYGTVQRAQQAQSDIVQKQAKLASDKTGVASAEKQISVLQAQLEQARAALAQQQANEHQAELNLSYTTITAPFDGTVGVRTLQVGQFVQPGTQLMAIVPLHAVYITANYMETQLTHVRAGQPVTINVDTFDGTVVHGHVESLAPASGQQFALLPPDNATGNFTKIVQRIPVKIALDPNDPLAGRLRPGMSVEPTIDTKPPRDAVVSTLNRSKVNG